MIIYCYGITKKKKRCKRYGPNNGYCHQHINQDLTGRPTCFALNTRGIRCMMSDYSDNKCRLHNTWRLDLASYWSIINDNEVIISNTLQRAEEYFEKHERSNVSSHHFCKGHGTYLYRRYSPIKIDVLIDLINEFIGMNYIWIAIGQRYKLSDIDVVGMDCKHTLEKASIYCVKIGKVYERSNLESQLIIT